MIDRERNFIFVHIPKTGGSSIESLLLGSDIVGDHKKLDAEVLTDEKFAPFFPLLRHAKLRDYEQLLDRDGESLKDFRIFTVVRNPEQLLRSAYRFRLKNHEIRKRVTSWPKRLQFRLEHATFTSFLLIQGLRSIARRGHFPPLRDFISSKASVDVQVFKLEELSNDPSGLVEYLKLNDKSVLPHKNKTQLKSQRNSFLLAPASRMIFPEICSRYQ